MDVEGLKLQLLDFYGSTPPLIDYFMQNARWNAETEFPIDVQALDPVLRELIIKSPDLVQEAATDALKEHIKFFPTAEKIRPKVVFYNANEPMSVKRITGAEKLRLVTITGIVNNIFQRKHKPMIAVYICEVCDAPHKVHIGAEKAIAPAKCDSCKRKGTLKIDEEASTYVDVQKAVVQDSLDRLQGNEQPATMNIWLYGNLIDSCSAGQKVELTGILRFQAPTNKKKTLYTHYLDVQWLTKIEKDFEDVDISAEDARQILEFAKRPDITDVLVSCLAPDIYGMEKVKEGILCSLFGGTPNKPILGTGRFVRSIPHVLLCGDPSEGKTRLLRSACMIAPKATYVTAGKGSTGVGLTAAVMKGEDDDWHLKAGAGVLMDNGVLAIDEISQSAPEELIALHEMMEDGRVSISKAGINATFNARTTILAATNPSHGRFDKSADILSQVRLSPPLLSRFDLIFTIFDMADAKLDAKIYDRTVDVHTASATVSPPVPYDFLRKYIAYAKKNIRPMLNRAVMDGMLKDFYTSLRAQGAISGSHMITIRQLGALIRLSEAEAKMRLSQTVDEGDMKRAIQLFEFTLRQVAMDPSTGAFDIDAIETGVPKTKLDKLNKLLALIRDLESNGSTDRKEVVARVGLREEEAQILIDYLVRQGDVFVPRYGRLTVVKR